MSEGANETPAPGERWRHYKGGVYEVVAMATHEESTLPYVVYRDRNGRAWCRPLFHWHQVVRNAERPQGVRRFTREPS